MSQFGNDLTQFQRLRAQVRRKKELETARTTLQEQCDRLSVHAKETQQALQQAEKELAQLESTGPMGVLFAVAGGKQARQETARKDLRDARQADQKASWELADVHGQLMQAERELADLAGCEESFAAVRQRRLAALRAAGLPQSQLLARLEEQLDQESQWLQALAAMGTQGQDALEQAKYTLTLAAKLELSRPIFLVQTLQDAADLTIQQQQALLAQTEQLTAQVRENRARLEEAVNDLLGQDLPL